MPSHPAIQRRLGNTHKGDKGQKKTRKVLREFKGGRLQSGSGRKVVDRKQALAIALDEARDRG